MIVLQCEQVFARQLTVHAKLLVVANSDRVVFTDISYLLVASKQDVAVLSYEAVWVVDVIEHIYSV